MCSKALLHFVLVFFFFNLPNNNKRIPAFICYKNTAISCVCVCVCCDFVTGLSKGVGFIRFDQRHEAEQAIKALNGTIPRNSTDPIVVKFANNPSNGKMMSPLMPYMPTPSSRPPRHGNFNPSNVSSAAVAAASAAVAIQHSTGVNRYG